MMMCPAWVGRYAAMVAGVRLSCAPGRGKLTVEEHCAVEFHGLEHFGQHVHRNFLGEAGC
jgi:hypothetical protein